MTPSHWINHPGRNPAHRFGEGRKRWKERLWDPRLKKFVAVTMLGPKNPSRWLPHQGKREIARRLRQAA